MKNTTKSKGFLKGKPRILKLIEFALENLKEKISVLKVLKVLCAVDIISGLACLTTMGLFVGGGIEETKIVKEYKETAIYQKLMEEDVQRITDTYKNEEISPETYAKKLSKLDSGSQCEEYIRMDYEENKEFQPKLKAANGISDAGMWGAIGSGSCFGIALGASLGLATFVTDDKNEGMEDEGRGK